MDEHLLNFTKGILPMAPALIGQHETLKRRDTEISERLGNLRSVNRHNYRDHVVDNELDVFAFVYTSDT